ncbi:hypothetical protein K443DRAFT_477560 [Laccaria amethystina LaAM-08-1]|uniref:Uncharacterized protein n=1 Tax=Laccaria amethystina LaAM-08-1 TaxID=1095629 RepID=A0A0C9WTJ5_9AGAR|nr:hypothetical protein K443DRAFT_477560 [Laccaria amethystina LaAM-08-1]
MHRDMFSLRSSQFWLESHSIVQERAGRRPLSEQHRTTPSSDNILACLPPPPATGFLPLGPVPDFQGIPAKECLYRRRATMNTK